MVAPSSFWTADAMIYALSDSPTCISLIFSFSLFASISARMNQFSIILLKKALFSSLSKYFRVFISLLEDYAIGTIKHLDKQQTSSTKVKLIMNKIKGVPITIRLSSARS